MQVKARRVLVPALVLAGVIVMEPAKAATIELHDGSTLKGVIECQADGACTVTLGGGQRIPVQRADIKRLDAGPVVPPVCDSPACSARAQQPDLRVAGSNSIGLKLVPDLLIGFVKTRGSYETLATPKQMALDEFQIEPTPKGSTLWSLVNIRAHGSGTGFQALAALAATRPVDDATRRRLLEYSGDHPAAEIAMSSRRVKANELEILAPLGRMDDPGSEHVIGLDGLAVIVNRGNRVESLTIDQIRQIFTGDITDWKQVGASPGPIKLYTRGDKSGTLDTFRDLVLEKRALAPTTQIEDSALLSDTVAQDPQAIGFIAMPFIRRSKAIAVNECSISYPPTTFNVKSEDYPLARRLFLYTPVDTKASVRDFIEYAQSIAGQKIVAGDDFVDLGVEPDTALSQSTLRSPMFALPEQILAGEKLSRVMQGAQRLSITFRFRSNTSTIDDANLDNRAIDDLKRLVEYMSSPSGRGRRIMLLGYTDSDGDAQYNRGLSRDRALAIKQKLARNGLMVSDSDIYGFGPDLPIACNTSGNGKARNRRVEVWLSR